MVRVLLHGDNILKTCTYTHHTYININATPGHVYARRQQLARCYCNNNIVSYGETNDPSAGRRRRTRATFERRPLSIVPTYESSHVPEERDAFSSVFSLDRLAPLPGIRTVIFISKRLILSCVFEKSDFRTNFKRDKGRFGIISTNTRRDAFNDFFRFIVVLIAFSYR